MFKRVGDVGDVSPGEKFKAFMNNDQGVFNYMPDGRKSTSISQESALHGWYFFIAQQVE
ncbi:MAG TPA: hypothetical protein VN371_09275 [Chlorobaculum sp.]|nr:hypothetical protein [Chlorobaculum sp.]